MRGPLEQAPREPGRVAATRTRARPEGGKALARLELFLAARGIEDVVVEVVAPAARARGRKRAARARREATPNIGALYAEAAEALHPAAGEAALGEAPPSEAPPARRGRRKRAAVESTEEAAPPPAPFNPALGPGWRSLGPVYMPNGQTYGSSRVDVSGRVSAIAVDPGNANHILVGSAAGGIWETRDRGTSWAARSDFAPTLTTGAIAFDPTAPATVYCGTGEGNWWARLGAGVMRSTDGGTTWTLIAGAPFVGQGFFDLLVDPANRMHLLAGTTNGLFESTNGGVAWAARRNARTWDLSMTRGEVLAACSDGVFRSTNGGTTWAAVTLPGAPAGGFDRLAVSHAPSTPAVAYAFGASGATAFLWRRATAGGAWTAVAPPAGLATGQAWYDWFLGVAPNNGNRIYVAGIEVYRGELSGTAWTWANITNKGAAGDSIHPDQHAIAFDPVTPDTIYVGSDGGLYQSPNRGTNWASLNRGLAITEIEYLDHDIGSSRYLLAGTQDNGSIRYTGSAVWEHAADGDGGDCSVGTTVPTTAFHSFFGMGMERSTTKGNFGSFGWIGPNVPANYNALFYPPLETQGASVAQSGQSVFVSRNSGTAWTEIALPAGCIGSAMEMPTPDQVLVGCTNGRIFRLTWSGAAWSAATALTTPRAGAWISDVSCLASNTNRIWATSTSLGGARVWRSDNGGSTWTDCSAGLPALPLNSVEVDASNLNRIWVAADLGVYQSLDAGATWATYTNGLPNSFVGDLVFHPHARVLRAGMRNRGVWEIPVDGWMTTPVVGTQWTGTIPANATQNWFTFNWPATWHMLWTVMPTTVRPGAPSLWFDVRVERATAEFATYWIQVRNLTPVPIAFEGRFAILSRY
jgi:hypothetical protein